jgi:hypothetical protein
MHNKSRLPAFLRLVIPDKYLTFESKRWDAYPHERSEMTNPGMGDDFFVLLEGRIIPYRPGDAFPDNHLGLNAEQLALRQVVWLDIVDSKPQPDKKDSLRGFVSPGGGVVAPLAGSKKGKAADETKPPVWAQSYPGEMVCAIRVIQVKFKWKGLQTMMEKNASAMNRNMSLDMHRKLVRRSPEWFPLSREQALAIEERMRAAMNQGTFSAEPSADGPDEPALAGEVPELPDEEDGGSD